MLIIKSARFISKMSYKIKVKFLPEINNKISKFKGVKKLIFFLIYYYITMNKRFN